MIMRTSSATPVCDHHGRLCVDGWMGEWIDDKWIDRGIYDGWIDCRWRHGKIDAWIDDGWMVGDNRWIDRWVKC